MPDHSNLNKAQKKAVTHQDGPLLILAGAGTGKTTVITQRVAWLIEQGLAKPDEILCLTFTDKAAGEMEERIDKLLPYGYVDLWVMTFHAFAERLLRDHAIDMGLPSDFRVLDETAQWMLAYEHIDKLPLKHYKPLGNPVKFIPDLLSHFSRLKDEGVSPEAYLDYVQELELDGDHVAFIKFGESLASPKPKKKKAEKDGTSSKEIRELWSQEVARMKELAECYAAYQRLLRENHALDFGDLIVAVRSLFEKRPVLLEYYRRQFKYVLVDEFQDTNWAQYDFVKLLANPKNNITVVGDDDQSVYKFRGATLSNILGFQKDFPGSTQVVLTENYRSAQNILDLAYGFIQNNNPDRLEFQLKQGSDTAGLDAVSKQLVSAQETKGLIEHIHVADINQEAAAVVKKILELRRADKALQWGDIAILARANAHAEPFLQALTLSEIPYQYLASQGLYTKPAVLDLISYLKVLDKYVESGALYRILILSTVDIDNEDLVTLLHHSHKKGVSLYESMKHAAAVGVSEAGVRKCETVLSRIQAHAVLARTKSVGEVAMAFVEDFGLRQYFETLEPLQQKETYDFLNHFWRVMRRFEAEQEDKSVHAFLQFLELTRISGDRGDLPLDAEIGPDTVKIMTIHGSKGLEFKYVFVVNMVDKRFPSSSRRDALPIPDAFIKEAAISDPKLAHMQEERRLCYVAITRAKLGLFLTSAEDYGGARAKKRSRFLVELGFPETPAEASSAVGLGWGQAMKKNAEATKAQTLDYKKYLPKSYSYTVLQTFKKCPWQFRYAHILKIPKAGSKARSFGQSLHKALELFFNQQIALSQASQAALFAKPRPEDKASVPSLEELLRYFDESWIDEWYKDEAEKKHYQKKGREFLRAFYRQNEGGWPVVLGTEKRFSIKLGGHTITGSIDRVDRDARGLHLIDYKSSKSPKELAKDKKDQLVLYHIAAEEVLKEPVAALTFYFLEDQQAKTFEATDKQKDKLKEDIVSRIAQIQSSDFAPTAKPEVCKNCDYKDICQYARV